jgi:5-methyltetrahydrofolate--homocysteine methyltransferase
VKISQHYDHGVVHVTDASRAVGVAGALLSEARKPEYLAGIQSDQEKIRVRRAGRSAVRLESFSVARNNGARIDFDKATSPAWTGTRVFTPSVAELRPWIDWTPFFRTWDLHGRYPELLGDPVVGVHAVELLAAARQMLDELEDEGWLRPAGVLAIWPAGRDGDDIRIEQDGGSVLVPMLRQQSRKTRSKAHRSLADFLRPVSDDGACTDHVGGFAVTAGAGVAERVRAYKAADDDYRAILLESLADRLAEAFAEWQHARFRRDLWGGHDEGELVPTDLIAERYLGIRPAPGYPACPDHTTKQALFEILSASEQTGMALTESMAMTPAASVSGWYFAHPESRYFGIGKIGRDQVEDYAARKGWSLAEAERWLAPNLGYTPAT